jgi:hypothetical protein
MVPSILIRATGIPFLLKWKVTKNSYLSLMTHWCVKHSATDGTRRLTGYKLALRGAFAEAEGGDD